MLFRFVILEGVLQKIWGLHSNQKVCCLNLSSQKRFCRKFGDHFPTKKYVVLICFPRREFAENLGTIFQPKSMLFKFVLLEEILQKILGPNSNQKVCLLICHPRSDFAENLRTILEPKSLLSSFVILEGIRFMCRPHTVIKSRIYPLTT